MRPIHATAVLAALALGSSAIAGPKPPATNVFEPEIGYTYASGNYMDLRLANRAGDKAVLVHRTGFGKLRSFDLSDEASKRIAFIDDTKLYFSQWYGGIGGALGVTGPTEIFAGPGLPESVDFSRFGDKLAFSVMAQESSGIRIFDFDTFVSPVTVLDGWQVFNVRWHAGDDAIYFVGRNLSSNDPIAVHLLNLHDGSVRQIIGSLSLPIEFDLERSVAFNSGSGIALNSGGSPSIRYYDGAGNGGTTVLAEGRLAHFNCANDAIIHRAFATRRPPTRITSIYGGFQVWSTDSNIHHTDWMVRQACRQEIF